MAKIVALYGTPKDPAAFDRYYRNVHVGIAKTIPGLRRYEMTRGPVLGLDGPSPWHLVATLTFDSVDAIHAALASPQGRATAADLANFATGGVELAIADTVEV